MSFKKTTIYFSLFILGIIVFDALQQQYYLTSFNILEEGHSVSFKTLFINHFLRWSVWGICSIPLVLISKKQFFTYGIEISTNQWIKIIVAALISLIASIIGISLVSMISSNITLTFQSFLSNVEFFIYQKGITFFFANCVVVLSLYSTAKDIVIDAQWVEIKDLRSNTNLSEDSIPDPQISIKIGNKIKLIPLSEVTWIESDDYCVKIHTEHKAYSMRKSLKSLEEQLALYRFIRVHRGALLNLGYLDQVDFESFSIKLQDSSVLPLSKSGAKVLRQALKATSI
jgi:hypothetical protein